MLWLLLVALFACARHANSQTDQSTNTSPNRTNPVISINQSISNTTNHTRPVIQTLSSEACILVPNTHTQLVNCSVVDYSDLAVTITAKNILNQSFLVEAAEADQGSTYIWNVESDWAWIIPPDNHTINQSINQHHVSLFLNLSTFPCFLRLRDHHEHSNYHNVSVEVNFCNLNYQMYYIDYPGLPNIVQCRECPTGSIINPNDQTICTPCAPETYYREGQCLQCQSNQFQPNTSSLHCYTCDDRPDMEECRIGDIPLAIAVIAALASPLITLAIVMCVIRQRALGRCLCKCRVSAKQVLVDFDNANEEFLQLEDNTEDKC